MSWYKTGSDGAAQQEEEEKKVEEEMNKPRRFWLAPGKTTQIVFLDSAGFFFKEHSYKAGGQWGNFVTCISDMGGEDCPFCDENMRYSYVCAFTVLDLTQFNTKKDNQLITASKKLFVTKGTATKKLLKKRERQQGDLVGCKFEVTRYEQKEVSTGSDFEFIERLTPKDMAALRMTSGPYSIPANEWLVPFDYMKAFEPKTPHEMRKLLGKAEPIGSDNEFNNPQPQNQQPTGADQGGDSSPTQDLSSMV